MIASHLGVAGRLKVGDGVRKPCGIDYMYFDVRKSTLGGAPTAKMVPLLPDCAPKVG